MAQRKIRSLIANEGYEVAFTRHDRPFFNARPIDPTAFDPAVTPINPADNFDWTSKSAILPIVPFQSQAVPVLLADPYRNLLIIQNNAFGSTAGGDVLPFLSIGLDGPVIPGGSGQPGAPNPFYLSLAPGVGIILDTRVPTNAIYVRWEAATSASGHFFQGGMLMYGRTLNQAPALPLPAGTPSTALSGLGRLYSVPGYRR